MKTGYWGRAGAAGAEANNKTIGCHRDIRADYKRGTRPVTFIESHGCKYSGSEGNKKLVSWWMRSEFETGLVLGSWLGGARCADHIVTHGAVLHLYIDF